MTAPANRITVFRGTEDVWELPFSEDVNGMTAGTFVVRSSIPSGGTTSDADAIMKKVLGADIIQMDSRTVTISFHKADTNAVETPNGSVTYTWEYTYYLPGDTGPRMGGQGEFVIVANYGRSA